MCVYQCQKTTFKQPNSDVSEDFGNSTQMVQEVGKSIKWLFMSMRYKNTPRYSKYVTSQISTGTVRILTAM